RRLPATSVPAAVGQAVRGSAAAGVEVARKLDSVPLLGSVRTAYVHGMDVMLWACGGIALTSALLALAFLPRTASLGRADPAEASLPVAVTGPDEENREDERHAR